METPPLILTLTLEKEALSYFDALRKEHFPPERNFLQALLTLFHKLPPDEPAIESVLYEISQHQQVLPLKVSELKSLGNGVAFKLESEALKQLHSHLQKLWQPFLSAQDKQKLRPHITIQNKVNPEVAKALQARLQETFTPFNIEGIGFSLWKYLGGPWEQHTYFPFKKGSHHN